MRCASFCLCCCLHVACGERAVPAAVDQPGGPNQESSPPAVVTTVAHPGVELLEGGADPRSRLRFQPTPGRHLLTVTIASTMGFDTGMAALAPTRAPTLRLTLATQTFVDGDDSLRLDLDATDVEVVPRGRDSAALDGGFEPTLGALKQLHGELHLGADGALREVSLSLPAPSNPGAPSESEQLRSAFSQAFVTLPEDPVGVGARWVVTSELPFLGSRIEQRVEFTLRARDRQRVELDCSISQRPAPTPSISGPDPAPGETRVGLDQLRTRGEGRVVVDLGQLVPVAAHSRSHSELTQTIQRDGQRQQVDVTLDLELDARSVAAAGPS